MLKNTLVAITVNEKKKHRTKAQLSISKLSESYKTKILSSFREGNFRSGIYMACANCN